MTTDQSLQIERWQADCAHIDALVNSCPDLKDMDLLLQWFNEIHGWAVYLATAEAQADTEYKIKFAATLEQMPDETWKRIKNSSTLTGEYMAGKHPESYQIWQRIRNLNRALETILSDTRTLLVNLREAEKRENMTTQNQGQDERKTFPNQNLDAYFPCTER